jgi:hypothetical protein
MIKKFNIFLLFFIFSNFLFYIELQSTDEKNVFPFYYLSSDTYILNYPEYTFLCAYKSKRLFNNDKFKTYFCITPNKDLNTFIKDIKDKFPKKKELKIGFFSNDYKLLKGTIQTNNKSFSYSNFVYNKKTKKTFIETKNEKDKYFIYLINPKLVLFEEKKIE